MARVRSWETSLSDRTRKSYLKEGAKQGWTESRVKAYYENQSNDLGILRRHVTKSGAPIPEHGIKDAVKNPDKYREYLKKNPPTKTGGLPTLPRDQLERQSVQKMDYLFGNYHKYNRLAVQNNMGKATIRELQLTLIAPEEQLLQLASVQRPGNPWYYHGPSW